MVVSSFQWAWQRTRVPDPRVAEEVRVLTTLRDNVLLSSTVERAFVKLYYIVSLPAADFIGNHNSATEMESSNGRYICPVKTTSIS